MFSSMKSFTLPDGRVVVVCSANCPSRKPSLRKQVLVTNALREFTTNITSVNPETPFPEWLLAIPAVLGRRVYTEGGVTLCVRQSGTDEVPYLRQACNLYGIAGTIITPKRS